MPTNKTKPKTPARLDKNPRSGQRSKSLTATHGGARPNSGRPKGAVTPEKKALKELAQSHTETAIGVLADICVDINQNGITRVSAASALLDRGHGKPSQSIEVENVTGFSPEEKAALDQRYEEAKLSGVWVKQKAEMKARKLAFEAGSFE